MPVDTTIEMDTVNELRICPQCEELSNLTICGCGVEGYFDKRYWQQLLGQDLVPVLIVETKRHPNTIAQAAFHLGGLQAAEHVLAQEKDQT